MGNGAHFPVWPNASQASRVSGDRPIRWSEVDFELASQNWDALQEALHKQFEQK
jgi:hypothetical protein